MFYLFSPCLFIFKELTALWAEELSAFGLGSYVSLLTEDSIVPLTPFNSLLTPL